MTLEIANLIRAILESRVHLEVTKSAGGSATYRIVVDRRTYL